MIELDLLTDDDQSNNAIPLSNWDGLLAAELLLRPNNEHTPIDLCTNSGRVRMAKAVREMDFIDNHDRHNIAESLDQYTSGPLPTAPKMSREEMKQACIQSNTSFTCTTGNVIENYFDSKSSPNRVDYNTTLNRFTLNSATLPLESPIITGDILRVIFWNCNGWDYLKSQKIAELASSSKVDIICVTDSRIDKHREVSAVDSFAKILLSKTDKIWRGSVSPKLRRERVGGDIIMFSNLVCRPKITHTIPYGVLSNLDCRWGSKDISIISIYRPTMNDEPGSLRTITETAISSNLENRIWKTISERSDLGPCYIAGDFNLSPSQVDDAILTRNITTRRVPMHGEIFSFRRWDSRKRVMQKSAIDLLLWNGLDHPPMYAGTRRLLCSRPHPHHP
jgi:exonuclease III